MTTESIQIELARAVAAKIGAASLDGAFAMPATVEFRLFTSDDLDELREDAPALVRVLLSGRTEGRQTLSGSVWSGVVSLSITVAKRILHAEIETAAPSLVLLCEQVAASLKFGNIPLTGATAALMEVDGSQPFDGSRLSTDVFVCEQIVKYAVHKRT